MTLPPNRKCNRRTSCEVTFSATTIEAVSCATTMHILVAGDNLLAPNIREFGLHYLMASRTLITVVFLLPLFLAIQPARAQNKLLPPPPSELAEEAKPPDSAALQQRRFLNNVAQAVIRLEASGERTMDAIENSQITLTLDTIQDSSRLSVLCNNGGKALNEFTQSLAGELQLNGKVNETVCTGAGRDDDPFVMKFRLHYENGRTSLFYEQLPILPFIVEKPVEDDPTGAQPQGEPPERLPQPAMLNPRRSQASHTVVQLAEGWSPVKLPDPVRADSPFGTVESTVTYADGALTLDRKLVLKRDKVEVAELLAFQEWTENVQARSNVALKGPLFRNFTLDC